MSHSLQRWQRWLQFVYGFRVGLDVDQFLVTDPDLARQLSGDARPPPDEQLLVSQRNDDLDLSLFVHHMVFDRLARDDPFRRLHAGNLESFCTALEGVSHFLYLVQRAEDRRRVNQLELELQAEVDKYIAVTALVGMQRNRRHAPGLHHMLFEDCRYDRRLDAQGVELYRSANQLAGKYCAAVERRFLTAWGGWRHRLWAELGAFYQGSWQQKLQRIEALA